jgi:hypothetical protein
MALYSSELLSFINYLLLKPVAVSQASRSRPLGADHIQPSLLLFENVSGYLEYGIKSP